MSRPLVTILINNYNYARFLGDAIDSALRQTHTPVEVLVIDDGSTDNSRDVIAGYGDRITAVFKSNGGQASAFNVGIAASRGEVLCFLDADDLFSTEKIARVLEVFAEHGLNQKPMMVHHQLQRVDDKGSELEGSAIGRTHSSPLNSSDFALRHRFVWFHGGPTSTICLNRLMADRLFPIPERDVRISADDFVVCGASIVGEIHCLEAILGGYRLHGANNWHFSARKKSPEFIKALEDYLNDRLRESGMHPAISLMDSIYVWDQLLAEGRWAKLAWKMVSLNVRRRDRYTIVYSYHKTVEAGMITMRWLRKKRDSFLKHVARSHSAS